MRDAVGVDVCIVAFGDPISATHTATAFRPVASSVQIVATSSAAAADADVALSNVGYGAAANAGFSAMDEHGDWFLVLNDDLDIDAHGAAALAATLADLDHRIAMWSFSGHSVGIAPPRASHPHEAPPHGAALAIRTDVFRRIAGFDARHFLYGEEVDLWLRLPHDVASGYEESTALHHRGAASSGASAAAAFELGRGTGLVNRRHRNLVRAAGNVLLRTAHVSIRRRQPRNALAFAAGFVHGAALPGRDGPAARHFEAAPRDTRQRIGAVQ